MKRPVRIDRRRHVTDAELEELARTASYVGSPEHKASRWWGGLGEARVGADGEARRPKKQLTTICPLTREADRSRATEWVREAILLRQFRFVEGDRRFPKHVWYTDADGRGWAGMCVNSETGEYKGWPVDPEEIRTLQKRARR